MGTLWIDGEVEENIGGVSRGRRRCLIFEKHGGDGTFGVREEKLVDADLSTLVGLQAVEVVVGERLAEVESQRVGDGVRFPLQFD